MQVRKQQLELDAKQQTGSKLERADKRQGCVLSPCLFNFYAEYIKRNTGLEESQAGIKIARKNINHFRYADDTTLMAESEEELDGETMERVRDFILEAPKYLQSLQMVTAAMK